MPDLGLFCTMHTPYSATTTPPLPVRESVYSRGSTGHLVRLCDFGWLFEGCLEKFLSNVASDFDAYPHIIRCADLAIESPHVGAVISYLSVNGYLDPDWTPASEEGQYGHLLSDTHGVVRRSPTTYSSRPRRLDDMRRLFYDLKMCTRRNVANFATVTTDATGSRLNAYGIDASGSTYSYDEISSVSVSFDLSRQYVSRILADQSFRAVPAFITARVLVHADGYDSRYLFVPLQIEQGGSVDIDAVKSDALRSILDSFYPSKEAGREYFAQFVGFSQRAGEVYCDVHTRVDDLFNGWNWPPDE